LCMENTVGLSPMWAKSFTQSLLSTCKILGPTALIVNRWAVSLLQTFLQLGPPTIICSPFRLGERNEKIQHQPSPIVHISSNKAIICSMS
jgi:hypothetical protein